MKIQKPLALLTGATLVAAFAGAMELASTPSVVTGSVKGRIVFEGDRPTIKPLTVTEEQAKGCCDPGLQVDNTNRELLIGDKGGIANVVVTIEIDDAEVKPLEEPAVLDQTKCRFEPHVAVIPVGSTIHYLNSDAVSHNVHTYATKNSGMNQTVSAGNKMEQTLDKAEVVKITCDIHPWMTGYVFVAETNHFSVSAEDGSFEVKNLPPGKYKVEMWHEKLGKAKADVEVKADGTSEALEVKMGEKKKSGGGRRRR